MAVQPGRQPHGLIPVTDLTVWHTPVLAWGALLPLGATSHALPLPSSLARASAAVLPCSARHLFLDIRNVFELLQDKCLQVPFISV